MCRKTFVTLIAVGVVAFLCGTFFTQPSEGQGKGQGKLAPTAGRFNLVAVGKDRYCVIDTATGHTWAKQFDPVAGGSGWPEKWTDEGIPSEKVK
jgi:hypothetical protein